MVSTLFRPPWQKQIGLFIHSYVQSLTNMPCTVTIDSLLMLSL